MKTSSDAGVVEGLAIARMFGRVLRHPAHQLQELAAKEGPDSVAAAVVLGEDVDPLDLIGGTVPSGDQPEARRAVTDNGGYVRYAPDRVLECLPRVRLPKSSLRDSIYG